MSDCDWGNTYSNVANKAAHVIDHAIDEWRDESVAMVREGVIEEADSMILANIACVIDGAIAEAMGGLKDVVATPPTYAREAAKENTDA